MTIKALYPNVRPSLDLNFARTRALDPRITFTRIMTGASVATFVGSDGLIKTAGNNVPRFDHNPTTGESLGLLVEEARTNLLLNSATLSTQSVTVAAAANTLSFYGTGTVTLTGVSTAGPLVGTGANNRVSLTFTPTVGVLILTVSGSVTNAQLEAGAFPTSYIPTTSATATRAVDVVSITGSNFSSWYNQTEGTFAWSGSTYNTQYANQNAFRVTEGTNLRGIGFGLDARTGTDDAYFSTRNNTNITSVNSSFPYVTVTSNIRIGGAFGTDIAASFNGSTPLVASPAYVFGTESQIEIMSNKQISGTANQYNGHTRRLTFWPIRLSNEVLQRITQ